MSQKDKKKRKCLNHVEHLLILILTITFYLISAFASLVCVPVGITSSAIETKIFEITARIKKCKSIIKKKKEHDKIVLLGKKS